MPAEEKTESSDLEKAIDKVKSEIALLRDDIDPLSTLPDIAKSVETLGESVAALDKKLEPVARTDDILKALTDLAGIVREVRERVDWTPIEERIAALEKQVQQVAERVDTSSVMEKIDSVERQVQQVAERVDTSSVMEKIDSVEKQVQQVAERVDTSSVMEKIDSVEKQVQQVVGLEERLDRLSDIFNETREIVSIIVQQLDDIERKYNKALEEVKKALALTAKVAQQAAPAEVETAPAAAVAPKRKPTAEKAKTARKGEPVPEKEIPATIDTMMEHLLSKVTPHTEAAEMARLLEETRDRLTDLIKEHTPVIFQFGKMARELKSYPPTATLNENDIARLNKEIRAWAAKLKEIAEG